MKRHPFAASLALTALTLTLSGCGDNRRAAGDGISCGSGGIQQRIDRLAQAGGGTLRIDPGDYPVAFLELKSNVRLELAEGARLYAETNALLARAKNARAEHERNSALIVSYGATNVAITGKGVVDGLGQTFRPTWNNCPGRWKLIVLQDTKDILIEGVTLTNSASWTCYFKRCENVVARNVKLDGHANYNNDGFDIEASRVLIEDCVIDVEDDAICGKIHDSAFVSEDVVVRNCRISSNCNFFKLGTASHGTFRNWRVYDNVFTRCRAAPLEELQWFRRGVWGVEDKISGISAVALEAVDGGRIEDIKVRNLKIESGVQTPFFLRVAARKGRDGNEWNMRNIMIEDVSGVSCSWIANSVTGVPSRRIGGDIVFRNIDLTVKGGLTGDEWKAPVPEAEKTYPENRCFGTPLPAHGFYLRHADGVRFENVNVRVDGTDPRPMLVKDDCTEISFGSR